MTLQTLRMESFRLLNPVHGNPMLVAAAIAIGVMLYALGGVLMGRTQPVEVAVHSIAVVTAAPGVAGRALEIEVTAPEADNCTRTSQQFLYQDVRGRRFYYPIGSALNGAGFAGSKTDFTLVLSLPTTLQAGDYYFVQRSAYICNWFGGFISRRLTYQTPERLVHLGPGPGA